MTKANPLEVSGPNPLNPTFSFPSAESSPPVIRTDIKDRHTSVLMLDNISEFQTYLRVDRNLVPAGTWHNVINMSSTESKLYTVYSPPNHPDGTVHKTKKDAEKAEAEEYKV
jgi:hypothetical protein